MTFAEKAKRCREEAKIPSGAVARMWRDSMPEIKKSRLCRGPGARCGLFSLIIMLLYHCLLPMSPRLRPTTASPAGVVAATSDYSPLPPRL